MACADGESRRLENDNPLRPIPPPPYGMEEFFKEAPQQPDPARARLGRRLVLQPPGLALRARDSGAQRDDDDEKPTPRGHSTRLRCSFGVVSVQLEFPT